MVTSSYVTIFEWPLAAILDFREKKHAPGKLWDFLQVIKDDYLFSFILFFSIFTPENA